MNYNSTLWLFDIRFSIACAAMNAVHKAIELDLDFSIACAAMNRPE